MSKRICVYCSSSNILEQKYTEAAESFAKAASLREYTIVCGGSCRGLMGTLIDKMNELGGDVEGVMPAFMKDIELHHPALRKLTLVDSMSRRKEMLRENAHAVVALPGGIGTIEELIETYTLKRLGLYPGTIILLNLDGFFNPLLQLFAHLVSEKMLNRNWSDALIVVEDVSGLVNEIEKCKPQILEPKHYAPA